MKEEEHRRERDEHRNDDYKIHHNEHKGTDSGDYAREEETSPYYHDSPVYTGHVDYDYFNQQNYSPIGYIDGGYNDPLAHPDSKPDVYMVHWQEYDRREPHPWYNGDY